MNFYPLAHAISLEARWQAAIRRDDGWFFTSRSAWLGLMKTLMGGTLGGIDPSLNG